MQACAQPTHPERVGLWIDEVEGELAFVYDGCTVTFTWAMGLRDSNDPFRYFQTERGLVRVDIREYARPPSYFRARGRWEDDGTLVADSLVAPDLGGVRWDGETFQILWGPRYRMRRVQDLSTVDERARLHLCPRSRVPTEAEWLEERGLPLDTPRGL